MIWYLLLVYIVAVHGKWLQAGKNHSKTNFHMIVQLRLGIESTGVRFVDCDPTCATGHVLYSTDDVTKDDAIRWKKLNEATNLYDIQYSVPQSQHRAHVLMAVRPSDCSSSSCESTEESLLECRSGTIKSEGQCKICEPGKYQQSNECVSCSPGRVSLSAQVFCSACEAGKTSQEGSRTCQACAEGRFSKAGDAMCTVCPSGFASEPSSSSCNQKLKVQAEVTQQITISGGAAVEDYLLSSGDSGSEVVEGLRNIIADSVGVPKERVQIVSIGQKHVSSRHQRRLSAGVVIKYRILVETEKDIPDIEEKTKNLQESPTEFEIQFKQFVSNIPDIDVNAISVSIGQFTTEILSTTFFTDTVIIYISVAVVVLAVLLFILCKCMGGKKRVKYTALRQIPEEPKYKPIYMQPLVKTKEPRIVLKSLIKDTNKNEIKF